MYPTRIGPSPSAMEENYTGYPRDPKSGYLVRDLSRLQTFKNIDIENIISSYTLLVVAMHFVAPRFGESCVGISTSEGHFSGKLGSPQKNSANL